MAENRFIGDYPVIGIRPVIDGRRGPLKVRESLEEQTMNMAKAAQKLLTENLKYSNGEPVKVIISSTTIGRVAEAAQCADEFRKAGVDITLSVTPCWCYGSETMDMDKNTIKGVWGFNGTERPGAVYLASVLAAHAQKGLPAFGIYGKDVQEATATDIPEDVTACKVSFSMLHNSISYANKLSGEAIAEINLNKQTDGTWTSPIIYTLPSCNEQFTISICSTVGDNSQVYGYIHNAQLAANTPYNIMGSYKSGFAVNGVLNLAGWNAPQEINFTFGAENNENSDAWQRGRCQRFI